MFCLDVVEERVTSIRYMIRHGKGVPSSSRFSTGERCKSDQWQVEDARCRQGEVVGGQLVDELSHDRTSTDEHVACRRWMKVVPRKCR